MDSTVYILEVSKDGGQSWKIWENKATFYRGPETAESAAAKLNDFHSHRIPFRRKYAWTFRVAPYERGVV